MSSFAGSKMAITRALIFVLLTALLGVGMSKAEVTKSEVTKSEASKKSADAIPEQSNVIRGEITQVEVSLTRLRDLHSDIESLKGDVKSLYGESTRKVVHIQSSPNIIGTTVVNIPYRFETGEYMPPRKRQVTNYVAQMGPTLKLLKENVEETESGCRELLVPEGIKDDFQHVFSDWSKYIKQANASYDKLDEYVKTGRLSNEDLGSKALQLGEDVAGIDRTLKTAFKLVKRANKKHKNDKLVPVAEGAFSSGQS